VDRLIQEKKSRIFLFIATFSLIGLFFYFLSLDSISSRIPQFNINGNTMGTTYSISIRNANINNPELIKNGVDSILNVINNSMSTYIDNSEISLFNKIEKNKVSSISEHFYNVFKKSNYYYNLSEKKFDPTIGPLYDLWGFKGHRILDEPTKLQVKEALDLIGMDKIFLVNKQDSYLEKYYLSKRKDGVSIDFSAIAKGYAVDVISEYLINMGFTNHFVEIGGEIRTSSNSRAWSIGIQNPLMNGSMNKVDLLNKSIATSGNYANYIEYLDTGSIKTHIIDPKTGYPLDMREGVVSSATVIADKCIDADALATILMLLDIEKGIELVEQLNDTDAYIVYLKDSILYDRETSGFKQYVK